VAADHQDHTVVIHIIPGETLDERWHIESRLGQGAMGSVFRGRDLRANRSVAVKILSPEHCRKPKVVARFEREAELMTTLRHPNLVQLYGHGRRGALPYIVMELLEGLTLAEVLQHEAGKLALPETIAVLKQLASGLSFLHHHGLVHRDVKPQNVIINAKGRVTILDLGVVRDRHNPGLTRPGAMVGTPYYMSPEQIAGLDDVDRRTDVYALAAMTFELLTGRPPFLGKTNFDVLHGHKHSPPPDASALVKTVSKPVARVLRGGLAKRRDERPATVSELIADLEAAAGTRKVDLAKAFAFIGASAERTRAAPRPEPARSPAHDAAAASEPDDAEAEEHQPVAQRDTDEARISEGKTVVFRQLAATYVGPAPLASNERTSVLPAVKLSAGAPGTLEVQVSARGRPLKVSVELDGHPQPTPCAVPLAAGTHHLRVAVAGHRSEERTVDVLPGKSTKLRLALEPADPPPPPRRR
jgi:serine/threonine-protein kinase